VAELGKPSRFYYAPKPTGREAAGNPHPTKKPVKLCTYLARLILPPGGGRLLVPFSGSGSEVLGALRAGWREVVAVEREARWLDVARGRLTREASRPVELRPAVAE
jgi:DNA modification methylase